jgi:hypothetical protein
LAVAKNDGNLRISKFTRKLYYMPSGASYKSMVLIRKGKVERLQILSIFSIIWGSADIYRRTKPPPTGIPRFYERIGERNIRF